MLIQNIFRQYRSSILFLIFLSTVLLLGITNAYGQTPQSITIVIDDTVGVQADWDSTQNRYDPNRLHTDVTTVTLTDSGYYRIHIKILYNSGDEQTNETFFMTVLSSDGTTITPVDSNAGPYKIVFDDPGPRHTAWRDAGLFHFPPGDNTLQMHHVAAIMDEYPELLNGPLGESESVKVPDSLKLVPPLIEDRSVDLSVSLKSKTDSAIVVDSDSINITTPGGTVRYTLTVFNHSPDSAKNATLTSLISQKFNVENFSLSPQRISGDTLIWEFSSIPPLVNININYDGAVDTNIAANDSLLITHVDLFAPMDTTNYNNSATDTVLIQFPGNQPMNRSVDLEISLISETDSVLVENGDSTNVVFPGGKVRYTLTVLNHSPDSAKNVTLNNLVAPNFNIENISLNPKRVSGDSLIWEFSSLLPLSNLQIQYDGSIDTSITKNDSLLIAQAKLIAANDTTAFNNSASDTILIKFKAKNPLTRSVDLGISLNAETDSVIIVDGDSVYVTFPGGDIHYILTIFNHSPDSAKNVILGSLVSPYFTAENFNLNPIRVSIDSLLWEFLSLPPLSDLRVQFKGILDDTISKNDSLLIAYGWIHAVNDTTPQNNSASDTLLIKFPHREPVSRLVDLEISLISKTDSIIVVDGDSTNFTIPGGTVKYTLAVYNHSPDSAKDITLTNVISPNFNIDHINLIPNQTSGNTLIWNFTSLPPLSNVLIQYDGKVDNSLSQSDSLLIARAMLTAANDSTANNNSAIDTVLIGFSNDKPRLKPVDLSLDLISETGFSTFLDGKNISVASPGQNIDYTLTVFNHSPDSARDVLLINLAPRVINIGNININPKRISGDSLFWEFPALPALSDITIHYTGTVHDDIPINENFLITYAFLSASNDSTANNNEAIDSVLMKFPTDFTPKIEAIPSIVDVTDSIQIQIQIPESTEIWDLWIHRPDGIVERDFADQFIISTPVMPNSWYEIDQRYAPSWLITTEKEEQLIFEIHCYDFFNNEKTAQAVVTVRSSNYLVLDRNVFRPEAEEPLGIRFKLSNRRIAQLDIYDISGRHIIKITEDVYQGGWNTYPWNGMTHNGQKVGGGVYLVTLRSGEFNSWKKFVLIR